MKLIHTPDESSVLPEKNCNEDRKESFSFTSATAEKGAVDLFYTRQVLYNSKVEEKYLLSQTWFILS